MPLTIRRRELIAVVRGAATAWPRWAQAQQPRPVIGFIDAASPGASSDDAAAFGEGLKETGYYDGQNVAIEPHWLDGRYDRRVVEPSSTPADCSCRFAAVHESAIGTKRRIEPTLLGSAYRGEAGVSVAMR
jgi:hypothetical protein